MARTKPHIPHNSAHLAVAIVGRPNVGKSTIFNLLARGEKAVTHSQTGTTRDVRRIPAELFGLEFTLLDTAGIEVSKADAFATQLNQMALKAASQADVLLLVIDGSIGVLPADRELARQLRKFAKTVIAVLNKADLKTAESYIPQVETLGFGTPVVMSAAHSQGVDALHEALEAHIPYLPKVEIEEPEIPEAEAVPAAPRKSKPLRSGRIKDRSGARTAQPIEMIAILGRPNVGKSTLINTLVGKEVMLTGPTAGLTRDAIGHPITYKEHSFTIIDTPGLRRKSRVDDGMEYLSVGQSLQAVEKADIIVLVVDASGHNIGKGKWQIFEQQDAHLASMIINKFKPLIIALAKWDAVENKTACLADVQIQLHHRLHDLHQPLVVPISSIKNKGIGALLDAMVQVKQAAGATFSTGKLNNLLNKVLAKRSPPLANGKVVSRKFIRQTGSRPPTFTFWGNRIDAVSNSYKQFLRNQLAEVLGLAAVPVRVYFKANANPFGSRKFGASKPKYPSVIKKKPKSED